MPDYSFEPARRGLHAPVRQALLILVSLSSMAGAGAALWAWISPETIQGAETIELFGVLSLLFLPIATLAAMEADRRRAMERSYAGRAREAAVQVVAAPAPPAAIERSRTPAPGPIASPTIALKVIQHPAAAHDASLSGNRHRARSAPECSPGALHH